MIRQVVRPRWKGHARRPCLHHAVLAVAPMPRLSMSEAGTVRRAGARHAALEEPAVGIPEDALQVEEKTLTYLPKRSSIYLISMTKRPDHLLIEGRETESNCKKGGHTTLWKG